MAEQPNNGDSQSRLQTGNLGLIVLFVTLGIVATTLPQPQVLGKIPLQHLLKSDLHVTRQQMAGFFLVCGLFWYLKPIAGILTDAFPLFKTRRRHYALISAGLAGLSWIGLAFAPHTYNALLLGAVVVNLFMVMLSTVVGAVLVEIGQSTGSVGRLTAVRQVASNVCGVFVGPVGGLLATGALGIACGVNSIFLFAFIPITYMILKERPSVLNRAQSFTNAKTQFAIMKGTPSFWWALVFISLFYFAPGFSTLLYYRQNDILKIDQLHIGYLGSIGAIGAIIGSGGYVFLVRRFTLKVLIVTAIALAASTTFFYFFYTSYQNAMIIDFCNGLFFGFAEVSLIDMAARATPVGSEGLGYSLILSFRNVALFGADYLGSMLADQKHWSWESMVTLNAVTTGIVLVLIPFIPKIILSTKDRSKGDPVPKAA